MIISSSREDLLKGYANDNGENPSNTTLVSLPPVYIQTVDIYFNRTEASHHYLAIYGVDTFGKKSKLSDIITIMSVNLAASIEFAFWSKNFKVFAGILTGIYVFLFKSVLS